MRSMWKGSISFGLVNIPVKMYTATQNKDLRFNQLHQVCHTPIKYEKVCPNCDRAVNSEEIVRGYEYEKGQFVIITDEEWQSVSEKSTRTVDILRFVELSEVDPVFYDKTYYLEPTETGGKAYSLLSTALAQSGKIAVARITIRTKSSLAIIRVYDEILALETIFYPDEIRNHNQLNVESQTEVQQKELDMALALISSLTESFQPELYENKRRLTLLELIEAKVQGKEIIQVADQSEQEPAIDLLAALQASIQAQRGEGRDLDGQIRH